MRSLLSIAGYDPSSGAGISKDQEVFCALGFHGLSVCTALVVQGPEGVRKVAPVADEDLSLMLDVFEEQADVAGVKLGVLVGEGQVRRVARFISGLVGAPFVFDPILEAKSGTPLTPRSLVPGLVRDILSLGPVVTPNLAEVETLTGRMARDLGEMKECAGSLVGLGARAAVVTGGHLDGDPIDVLFDGSEFVEYRKERIQAEIHGTGCLFSAFLLGYLARGYVVVEAFLATERRLEEVLSSAYRLGRDRHSKDGDAKDSYSKDACSEGAYSYASPGLLTAEWAERWLVIEALREAGEELRQMAPVELVPAVQMNLGFALPNAQSVEEVAAFPGRIGACDGQILWKGEPAFGVSSHIARLILTAKRRHPHIRACINLRLCEESLAKARAAGFVVAHADRSREPTHIREIEGMSLDFLMEQALASTSVAPDIVYDRGEVGREPLIRLFGRTPAEVIEKLRGVRP